MPADLYPHMNQQMEGLVKEMKEKYGEEEDGSSSNIENSGEDSEDINDEQVREMVERAKKRMMEK